MNLYMYVCTNLIFFFGRGRGVLAVVMALSPSFLNLFMRVCMYIHTYIHFLFYIRESLLRAKNHAQAKGKIIQSYLELLLHLVVFVRTEN